MAAYAVTCNGSPLEIYRDWHISAPQNRPATFDCQVWAETTVGLPTFGAEIVLTEDGSPIFGGTIIRPRLGGIGDKGTTAVILSITALDFNELATRRYVVDQMVSSRALKIVLSDSVVPSIPGATLAVDQPDGPTVEMFAIVAMHPQDVLDYMTQITGFIPRIDASKVLRMFEPGSYAAPFDLVEGDGLTIDDVTVEPKFDEYYNIIRVRATTGGVYLTATAQDAAGVAAYGELEQLYVLPDETPQDTIDATAPLILATKTVILRECRYKTLEAGLAPGQTQTINLPSRGIDNIYLITEVNTDCSGGVAIRSVTAIEGLVYQPGWRENTRQMFGGGVSVASASGPGTGTSGLRRFAYPLGGAASEFVQSPGPTWVDASPNTVQISTVARGTTSATIVAQLKAVTAGVSVQARLYDVTAATPCPGLSVVVTNTDWQTVTWTVTLTAGSHLYKVQVLPGAPNEPVGFIGYLE